MFYIIESEYVGPNPDQHLNDHCYLVQTVPGRKNMSHEICIDGWLGTTNDWSETAHGEYDTLEEAKTRIDEILGSEYREPVESYGDEIVYQVVVGKLEKWDAENSQAWCYEGMIQSITADSTDAKIDDFISECAADLEDEGGELDTDAVERMCVKHRDSLKDDEDE